MKVIMLSKDNKVFDKTSDVQKRMLEYGSLFDELHVVVFGRTATCPTKQQLSKNVLLYSPRSNNIIFIVLKSLGVIFGLNRKLKKEKAKVWISSQDPFETGLIALVASKIYKIKLQIQVHTDFLSPLFKKENIKNLYRLWLAKKVLPHADSIRVVSARIKNSLIKDSRLKIKEELIHILPIFVDLEKIKEHKITFNLREKYPQFKKIILIASRLEHEKNIPLALYAFSKIIQQYPDTGLIIAGSGSQEVCLKLKTKSLKLEANVVFEGWISDIYSAYKTADVLLITSLYEGYSMSAVEALASGCRVVSTDVGVAKEIGAIITNYDPGQVASKMTETLNSPKKILDISCSTKVEYLNKFKKTFV